MVYDFFQVKRNNQNEQKEFKVFKQKYSIGFYENVGEQGCFYFCNDCIGSTIITNDIVLIFIRFYV